MLYEHLSKHQEEDLKVSDCSIKKVIIDELDEMIDKWNDLYHGGIKINHVVVNLGSYIQYGVDHNDKDSNF